jgi:methionine-rich copper-binding protein CopC
MFNSHRLSFKNVTPFFAATCVISILTSCTGASDYTPLLNSEPGAGETINERTPRTLRLFYAALPDVDSSELTLTGPEGDYSLRGLHTMGADDLMVEIYQPALTNGSYTVKWQTRVGGDPAVYTGQYSFEVAIPE